MQEELAGAERAREASLSLSCRPGYHLPAPLYRYHCRDAGGVPHNDCGRAATGAEARRPAHTAGEVGWGRAQDACGGWRQPACCLALAPLLCAEVVPICPALSAQLPSLAQVGHTLQNDLKASRQGPGLIAQMRQRGLHSRRSAAFCARRQLLSAPPALLTSRPPTRTAHLAGAANGAWALHRLSCHLSQRPGAPATCLVLPNYTARGCVAVVSMYVHNQLTADTPASLGYTSASADAPAAMMCPAPPGATTCRACRRCPPSSCWCSACWGARSRTARTTATPMPPAPWRSCRWGGVHAAGSLCLVLWAGGGVRCMLGAPGASCLVAQRGTSMVHGCVL